MVYVEKLLQQCQDITPAQRILGLGKYGKASLYSQQIISFLTSVCPEACLLMSPWREEKLCGWLRRAMLDVQVSPASAPVPVRQLCEVSHPG